MKKTIKTNANAITEKVLVETEPKLTVTIEAKPPVPVLDMIDKAPVYDFSKIPKQELIQRLQEFLTGDLSNIDANLISRVKYTLSHAQNLAKVAKKDLTDLCSDVSSAIVFAVTSKKADASPKKETSLKKRNSEKPASEPAKPEPTTPIATPPSVKAAGQVSSKSMLPNAKLFPATLEDKELGTLVNFSKKIHTYDDIVKFLENDGELFIATYWTARHIKEYNYSETRQVPCPASFPNNLDLLPVLMCCENVEHVWAMSRYTEAMFLFKGEDFIPVEDKDPVTNESYEIRVSSGMEFELYGLKK